MSERKQNGGPEPTRPASGRPTPPTSRMVAFAKFRSSSSFVSLGRVVSWYVRDVQMIAQAKAVCLTLAWSGIGSVIVFKIVDIVFGSRVAPDAEQSGLDVTQHGERGYAYGH